eukprot:PhM_4_TR13639/c2_g2_i7/m.13171
MHDAALYQGRTPLFVHNKDEMWLGDLGYKGCSHCLVPFKKKQGQDELPIPQAMYNTRHGLIRSRVERFFRKMRHFRVFKSTEHKMPFIESAAAIVLNVMYLTHARGNEYPNVVGNLNDRLLQGERCLCSEGLDRTVRIHEGTLSPSILQIEYKPRRPAKAKRVREDSDSDSNSDSDDSSDSDEDSSDDSDSS